MVHVVVCDCDWRNRRDEYDGDERFRAARGDRYATGDGVAEVADREQGSCRHAVIRAGKFIADSSWLGSDYHLRYSDAAQASAAVHAIPVSAIALYTGKGRSTAHGTLIRELVAVRRDWSCIHSERTWHGQVGLWTSSRLPQPNEIRLPEMNLMRKLGRNIFAEF